MGVSRLWRKLIDDRCIKIGARLVSINQPVPGNYLTPPPPYYIYYWQGALRLRGDLIMAGLRFCSSPLTSHSTAATYTTRTLFYACTSNVPSTILKIFIYLRHTFVTFLNNTRHFIITSDDLIFLGRPHPSTILTYFFNRPT